MFYGVSLRSVSNSSSEYLSERCSGHHHWETKQTNFSDQCQTKFLLPKSQNEFYDLLPIPSCTSSTKTKVKDMENMLIFRVTLWIQILTLFSVQSQYSKKTKNISFLGFVISNKTCKIWNMQIRCQPSTIKVKTKFTFSNVENIQWIHLTTDVKFSQCGTTLRGNQGCP